MPFVTLPMLVQPLNGGLYAHIFRVEDVLQQGIVFADISTFFAGQSGSDFMASHGVYVRVKQDEIMYIPLGYFMIPIYYAADPKDKSWLHTWALPLLDKALFTFEGVNVSERTAIIAYNENYLRTKGTVYAPRLEYLLKLKTALEE